MSLVYRDTMLFAYLFEGRRELLESLLKLAAPEGATADYF